MESLSIFENHPLPSWPRALKILVVNPNFGGCAYYRSLMPFKVLQELYPDHVEIKWDQNPLGYDEKTKKIPQDFPHENIKWADVVMVNNISNYGGPYTARVVAIAKTLGKFVHFDTDDLLTELYPEHRLYDVYKDHGLSDITKYIYSSSDLVTVTQAKFLDRIKPFCPKMLGVIKNAIDYRLPAWNAPKRDHGKRIHVGWAGGIHHRPDVLEFASVPHLVNQKVGREKVFWDFYGCPNVKEEKDQWQLEAWAEYRRALLRGFKGQQNWRIHHALTPADYGVVYSNMDIAIAPLKMNQFNDSKCFRKGQLVLCFDGTFKAVEDLKIGDVLLGPDSKSRLIQSTTFGEDILYEISPNKGSSFAVTENHILHLLVKGKEIDVTVKDYLNWSSYKKNLARLYRVPVDFKTSSSLEIDPYILGLLLGDGSMKKKVSITTADKEIEEVFKAFAIGYGENIHVTIDVKANNKAATYTAAQKQWNKTTENPIMHQLRKLNLGGIVCENKFVPLSYKTSSRKNRLEVLAGLIDSDGSLSSNKTFFSFTNKSKQLVEDVIFLAQSLGFYASPIVCFNEKYYRTQISGHVNLIPTRLERKKANPRKTKRNPLVTKFKVTRCSDKETYYGFKVDKDGLFLLSDFMVSHNSDIKLAECGRYKVPLIASDVGCYNETIINGQTGFLIPPNATKTLWVKTLSDLVKNPKQISEMGNNLHQITQEKFDILKVAKYRLFFYELSFDKLNYNPFTLEQS